VPFNTLRENQRARLVLSNGMVYVAWASHGDNRPYHGGVIGFNASTLAIAGTFNANPNGNDSGIWMSGGAPAADSSGNLYFLTGNGTVRCELRPDYGDSTLKLSTSGGLSVAGYFTPADQQNLEGGDTDHGSGGAAILVDQPSGPHQHLVIRVQYDDGTIQRGANVAVTCVGSLGRSMLRHYKENCYMPS
jgi:hypothetical protein